ncbi:family 4 glycosyl hydrolase [Clostridium estertheticum]|uniref:family 4 glycosyl hydrolase n=1 Tax=Clostridium estertheticum TaxID=238834 RepID=UPI001C0D606B|nr:alpha-glucosidase/alpha-galactosidase [Clostridium estertheticum]MBU3217500.1 alpha-glucosidase/alpha-galactosidase [Clostridium estertheticum]
MVYNFPYHNGHAKIKSYTNRKDALRGANYVVNAIQVGGYDPCTITDFEIPKKYGLRQTIADTLGIGGIFRALRTIPVMLDFAKDMEEVCPNAWFLNYSNPMAMLTGAMLKATSIKTVGLCHSVQKCVPDLLKSLDIGVNAEDAQWKIAGINHQAWLLEVTKNGKDLYPALKAKALEKQLQGKHSDMVENKNIQHTRTHEYASYIMEAMETGNPYKIGGNVLNTGLITNLPTEAIVEVPCLVDRSGVIPTYVGKLPQQLAALNRTNINPQLLTIEAALTGKRELIYMAAMLDPHTSAELSMDNIKSMCDDLIEAHGDWLPKYK